MAFKGQPTKKPKAKSSKTETTAEADHKTQETDTTVAVEGLNLIGAEGVGHTALAAHRSSK